MGDANALTKLAVLQALYKYLGEVLNTKDPNSLRGQVDYRLRELYEQAGVDRLRIMVDDVEVGKLSVRVADPKTRQVTYLNDVDALMRSHDDMFADFVAENAQKYAEWLVSQGIVPDGCEVRTETVPGGFDGTILTGCKPQKVLPMLGVGRVAGFLEEG